MNLQDREIGPTVSAMSAIYQSMGSVFASDERHRHSARRLLLATGVWMPLDVYKQWPVLRPWIVRDNKLANDEKGIAHPVSGLQRDDNGPIGKLKNGQPVLWATSGAAFKSKPLKQGSQQWWQCHVWEGMTTNPLTNSFVPNLVWLPEAIGRLTDPDKKGLTSTIFQEEIKAIAWSLYRDAPVVDPLQETVDQIWRTIPEPRAALLEPEEVALVNWFQPTPTFFAAQATQHAQVWEAVNALLAEGNLRGVAITPKTYRSTLPDVGPAAWASLRNHLQPFADAATQLRRATSVQASPAIAEKASGKTKPFDTPGSVLPIVLYPSGPDAFKAALLTTKSAVIEIHYSDGGVVSKPWIAKSFTQKSHVMGNLRARKEFRSGKWQDAGIVGLHVRVVGL